MIRLQPLFKFVFCLALSSIAFSPAKAGEWTELPFDGAWRECSHLFSGKIERGDLVNYLQELSERQEGVFRLCLNSPGGSLSEVLEVAKEFSFRTRVRSGDRCESACAILFMFGLGFGANSPFPDRMMDPGAKLGFHSPFIAGKTRVGATAAFKVAIEISKLLADRSYTTITTEGPAVPPELLSLVLGTPADQMRYVETIGELQLLSIEPTRSPYENVVIRKSKKSLIATMKRICASSYALTFRRSLTEEGYSFDDLVKWVETMLQENDDFANMEVHRIKHIAVEGDRPGRYEGMLTGPFNHPHWNSAGAQLYCQPTLAFQPEGNRIRITDFYVNFDFAGGSDLSRIAEHTQTYKEVTAGLLPIDTVYSD
ncbi:MAG: hypothetical protein AB3N20_03420 [Rhizobiaceae bacterium]